MQFHGYHQLALVLKPYLISWLGFPFLHFVDIESECKCYINLLHLGVSEQGKGGDKGEAKIADRDEIEDEDDTDGGYPSIIINSNNVTL